MSIHVYQDYSDLNAPYDQYPPRIDVGFGGLGQEEEGYGTRVSEEEEEYGTRVGEEEKWAASSYPWGQYSNMTYGLQQTLNEQLVAAGYRPLTVDGKLGAKTCGAARKMGMGAPSTCQSFTEPTKVGAPPPPPPLSPPPPAPTAPIAPVQAGVSGDTWWIIGGIAVAVVAVGGALLLKKKRPMRANRRRRRAS